MWIPSKKKRIKSSDLTDFNSVINYYIQMLDMVEKMEPGHIGSVNKDLIPGTAYERVIVNNAGLAIAQDIEISGEKNDIDSVISCELEQGSNQQIKEVLDNSNLSPFDTLKKVRHSLMHADFDLDTFDEYYYVRFTKNNDGNEKNYAISADDIDNSESQVESITNTYGRVHLKKDEWMSQKNNGMDVNVEEIKSFCRKLRDNCEGTATFEDEGGKIYSVIEGIPTILVDKEQKKIYRAINNDEQKNFYKLYVDFFRDKGKSVSLTLDDQFLILQDVLQCSMPGEHSKIVDFNDFYITIGKIKSLQFHGVNPELGEEPIKELAYHLLRYEYEESREILCVSLLEKHLLRYEYEGPLIYANTLLELVGYICYVKERNNKDNLFEYHNIEGMNGIEPILDKGPIKSIRKVTNEVEKKEHKEVYDKKISEYREHIKNNKERIRKIEKKYLNDNNPEKGKFEKFKEEYEDDNVETENKIIQLEIREKEYYGKDNEGKDIYYNYVDYSNFFRHIRNSIAHGTYKINYNKALKDKNLTEIEYDFYDYPKEKKEMPDFHVKLKAEQLLEIVSGVQKRVNKQLQREGNSDKIENINDKVKRSLTNGGDVNDKTVGDEDDGER